MSIGDSMLDYFSEKEIKNSKTSYYPKSKKFYAKLLKGNSDLYDYFIVHLKKNDDKYILYGIAGLKVFSKNVDDCYLLKDKIVSEVSVLFSDVKIYDGDKRLHEADKTGKSYTTDYELYFKDNSYISISCYDLSEDWTTDDHLRIIATSKEIYNFLSYDAY